MLSSTETFSLSEQQLREFRRLLAEHRIRAQVNRYVQLCDALGPHTLLDELLSLFTVDAVWEGRGRLYQAAFGRLSGREEIAAMFRRYMTDTPHFAFNAHFLCSELIEVDESGDSARARWLMLQPSTLAGGQSRLSGARLTLDLLRSGETWLISHFRTENLFNRAIDRWNDPDEFQVPQD